MWVVVAVGAVTLGWLVAAALRFLASGRHGLTAGELRVWGAYFETLRSTVDWGQRIAVDDLLADLGAMLSGTPPSVRWPLYLIVGLFDRLPLFLGLSLRRLSSLAPARRLPVLQKAAASRTFLVAAVFETVQTSGLVIFGGHPEVLKVCGVNRRDHVAACRAAREHALRGAP